LARERFRRDDQDRCKQQWILTHRKTYTDLWL
jgi:hypothetical protein